MEVPGRMLQLDIHQDPAAEVVQVELRRAETAELEDSHPAEAAVVLAMPAAVETAESVVLAAS